MGAEKAYVLGLLHDIGRKFGVRHLGHVSDGYAYMMCPGLFDRPSRINAIASSLVGSITYSFFPFPYALIKTNAENPHEYRLSAF